MTVTIHNEKSQHHKTETPYTKLDEWPFKQGQLSNAAPIPVGQNWWCAVASPHPRSLRQNLLQFWGGPARDQCADQGQGIVVEVTLQCDGEVMQWFSLLSTVLLLL